MKNASKYLAGVSTAALLSLAAFAAAPAAGEPAPTPDPPAAETDSTTAGKLGESHNMMGHSPAGKEMQLMKDKKVPIHHAGDPPSKSSDSVDCVNHNMMGHSPAGKEMQQMKDKNAVPTHNPCDPPSKSSNTGKSEKHNMMGHSPAGKEMRMMKDKKVPIHESGGDGKPVEESPPSPNDQRQNR